MAYRESKLIPCSLDIFVYIKYYMLCKPSSLFVRKYCFLSLCENIVINIQSVVKPHLLRYFDSFSQGCSTNRIIIILIYSIFTRVDRAAKHRKSERH